MPAVERLNAALNDAESRLAVGRNAPMGTPARAARVVAHDPAFATTLARLVDEVEHDRTAWQRGVAHVEPGPAREDRLRHELRSLPYRTSRGVELIGSDAACAVLARERARSGLTNADLARRAAPQVGMTPKSLVEALSRLERGQRAMRRDLFCSIVLATA